MSKYIAFFTLLRSNNLCTMSLCSFCKRCLIWNLRISQKQHYLQPLLFRLLFTKFAFFYFRVIHCVRIKFLQFPINATFFSTFFEHKIVSAKYTKVLICFTLFKKTAKRFFGAIPPSIRTATGLGSSCYFNFGEKKISREKTSLSN